MTKIGHGVVSDLTERKLSDTEYSEYMVEELRSKRPPPKPLPDFSNFTEEQKQQYYLDMQPPSTRAAMIRQRDRDPSEDIENLFRPMPDCIANPDAKTKEELIGERQLNAKEVIVYEDMRRSSKNTLGDSKKSSVSKEKREAGINAFTYSKPAELSDSDWKNIKKINGVKAVPQEEVKAKHTTRPEGLVAGLLWWVFPATYVTFVNGYEQPWSKKGWFTSHEERD